MTQDSMPSLDHYALKSMDYGQLTGVSIACHAISDGFLLMHVGVGCKNKATAHLLAHDWKEHGNLREAWTEVGDGDLILGASQRAAPYLRSWYKRMEPGLMIMVSVTFIDLAGEDLKDEIEKAAVDIPCPVMLIPAPGYAGDMYKGYASVVLSLAKEIPWETPPANPKEVGLLGYFFDRYEKDHSSNLNHIKGLLSSMGLSLGTTLLSGKPYESLLDAHQAGVLLELPYARPISKKLGKTLKGRETVQTDLPFGIAGTSRWLRQVGEAAGVPSHQTESVIEKAEKHTRKQVEAMTGRWRSMPVAVFAEPPYAGGLCSMLLELGLQPVLVGLKGKSLGGESEFRAVLEADGQSLSGDTLVLEEPSLARIRQECIRLLDEGRLEGIFGSATDLNILNTLSAKNMARGHNTGPLLPQGPFMVECGFPCRDYHALYPMPFLGYRGVEVWAQRILMAPRIWNAGRKPAFPG